MTEQPRKGARHPSAVPVDVLRQLERGAESANHMEQIALDMRELFAYQFPQLAVRAGELEFAGLVARLRTGGRILWEEMGFEAIREGASWTSDTARGWAAMAVGSAQGITLSRKLVLIEPYADDPHFAVREWAWLSLRPEVEPNLAEALDQLLPWTSSASDRLRRFATELTRPRGVWSTHIGQLKREPWIGLPLLEPLREDPSRYVRTSVGNWLNDAAKTNADWVGELCSRWQRETNSAATLEVCRKAVRSISPPRQPDLFALSTDASSPVL